MYEVPGMCISVKSVNAVVGKYQAVKMTADGAVVATTATDEVLGFIQREAKAGEVAQIMIDGITMAKASAAIAKGDHVAAAAAGAVAKATTGKFCGIAMEAATAAGDIIPVLIRFGTLA